MKKKIFLILSIVLTFAVNTVYCQSSYSLSQCKELAIQNNAKIKNAKLEISASEQVKSAANTKYYPQVSASFQGMYAVKDLVKMETQGGNLPVYDGNPANLPTANQFAYMPGSNIGLLGDLVLGSISVMQPIYAGGRISTGNELAELGKNINKDKLNIERYSILQKTEELYRQVLTLQEKMKTVEFFEKFLNNLQKEVNSAQSAGLIGKNDVLKVALKVNELQINKLKLDNGIQLSKEALCQHIGVEFNQAMVLTDSNQNIQEPNSYFLEASSALPNRFETNLLQKAIKANQLQTEMQRGEYLPEFAVGTMLAYDNAMGKGNLNCLFVATLSVPISGWWEGSYKIEETKIREEITKNTARETNELLTLQISKAWKDLNEAYKQIELGKNMLAQADENFKVNESNYKVGNQSLSDFLEAQATLQQSQEQLSEFNSNYQLALTKYLQAIGKYE